jgi:hypothetical protein
MPFYFYYQKDGQDVWREGKTGDRETIIQSVTPRYTTVLDLNTLVDDNTTREDLVKVAYLGPFYVDIDVKVEMGGIDTAIKQYNKLLDKLEEVGVDLECLRLYASGSKGFHLEVPMEVFMEKIPGRGITKLPLIYRHLVREVYVDGIDMVVYSSRRGRMWRTPNVQRENGKYKVQITPSEARELTVERYDELVAAPRQKITTKHPVYNTWLAVRYEKAKDAVEREVKPQASKVSKAQMDQWKANPPYELAEVLRGEHLVSGIGFQRIALQVSLSAVTLGWAEDELISRAEGLIANHVGDGNRYDTPSKRAREMRRMYAYFSDNAHYYEFAIGPLKTMLEKPEAKVLQEPMAMSTDPETPVNPYSEDEFYAGMDWAVTKGVRFNRGGIYLHDEGVSTRVSVVGFDNIELLHDLHHGTDIGYVADTFVGGRAIGRKTLTMDTFTSKQKFQGFTMAVGSASVQMSDQHVAAAVDIFREKAMKDSGKTYVTIREGVDWVTHPEHEHPDAIYVSGDKCISKSGFKYVLANNQTGRAGRYNCNLHLAPDLVASKELIDFLTHLFKINAPAVVGLLMGWMTSAHFSKGIRLTLNQFPSLQAYGLAGSGKSKSVELFAHLHYYKAQPVILNASARLTAYSMRDRLSSSSSIPVVWDEYKPHEMNPKDKNIFMGFLKGNYTKTDSEAGYISRETGQSFVDIKSWEPSAPMAFIGESLETETAVLDRSVTVPFTHQSRNGRKEHFDYCYEHRVMFAIIGRALMEWALGMPLPEISDAVRRNEKIIAGELNSKRVDESSRQVFNSAVALTGWNFFETVIQSVLGDQFKAEFQSIRDAMLKAVPESIGRNTSEASKVLQKMAYLSKAEHNDNCRMQPGIDYYVSGDYVELKLQNAYTRYVKYMRELGQTPLYVNYEKFLASMRLHPAVLDRTCVDSPLKDTSRAEVFKFSKSLLDDEGVDEFRDIN